MGTGVIIQARLGSTRLPGKVMLELAGEPVLWHVWNRASKIRGVDDVVIATTHKDEDRYIAMWCRSKGITCYAGSSDDVLDRYYQAATLLGFDTIVRITADCPMLDSLISSKVLDTHRRHNDWSVCGYTSNTQPPTYPDGLDTEVISYTALQNAWRYATNDYDREHVTPYLYRNSVDNINVENVIDLSHYRWTLDTREDFDYMVRVFDRLGHNFCSGDIMNLEFQHTLPRE